MTEPIVLRFTPTPQDYARVTRTIYLRQPFNWIFFALMALLTILIFGVAATGTKLHLFTILLGPVAILFFAILEFVVNPWMAGKRASKNERMTAEVTWEISEEQVLLKSAHVDSKTDWGHYKKVLENDEYFLFRSSTVNMYQFLPKRACESPAQMEAFRTLVKTKLPGLK